MGAAVTAPCMQHFISVAPKLSKCYCKSGSLMTRQLHKTGGTDYHSNKSVTTAVGYDY